MKRKDELMLGGRDLLHGFLLPLTLELAGEGGLEPPYPCSKGR